MSQPQSVRFLQWRAGRISDPVAKLRYLRTTAPMLPSQSAQWAGWKRRWPAAAVCLLLPLIVVRSISDATSHGAANVTPRRVAPLRSEPADVWVVESNAQYELYSNGLRIEKRFQTANHRR